MTTKLIVALDYANQDEALKLVDKLDPNSCAIKIGSELFTLYGAKLVESIIRRQFKVFLDLKFHDIPNTVAQACKACAELGVWMINVHALGGLKMMHAAANALANFGSNKPLLIAVTVLTSFAEDELAMVGINNSIEEQVLHLSSLALDAGLDGVVCSAWEVPPIKQHCGQQFLTITPGIRLASDSKNDQTRVMTPEQAKQAGSDFIVLGRSVTQAANPAEVVKEILKIITPASF